MLRDRSLLALTTAELVSTLGSQFSALAAVLATVASTNFILAILAENPSVAQHPA